MTSPRWTKSDEVQTCTGPAYRIQDASDKTNYMDQYCRLQGHWCVLFAGFGGFTDSRYAKPEGDRCKNTQQRQVLRDVKSLNSRRKLWLKPQQSVAREYVQESISDLVSRFPPKVQIAVKQWLPVAQCTCQSAPTRLEEMVGWTAQKIPKDL